MIFRIKVILDYDLGTAVATHTSSEMVVAVCLSWRKQYIELLMHH